MQEAALDCLSQSRCEAFNQRQFGVSLIDPVDHYRQSERTIKYAMLFIGLTFAAFFVFGILRDIEIHPMEYGLVGLALAIFYLLLLSLSEHLGFGPAYAIAAAACVALTGFYLCYVLNGFAPRAGLHGCTGAALQRAVRDRQRRGRRIADGIGTAVRTACSGHGADPQSGLAKCRRSTRPATNYWLGNL